MFCLSRLLTNHTVASSVGNRFGFGTLDFLDPLKDATNGTPQNDPHHYIGETGGSLGCSIYHTLIPKPYIPLYNPYKPLEKGVPFFGSFRGSGLHRGPRKSKFYSLTHAV